MNSSVLTSARLSPLATAVGLSAALIVLFVLCAVAQVIVPGMQASHAWISLFTVAPQFSARSWIDGIVWSVVFGAVAGAIFAAAYNTVLRRGA
jgi:hypothetical protein